MLRFTQLFESYGDVKWLFLINKIIIEAYYNKV